ncbi:hypothetical protein G9A89_015300 [Geosiphon pyriformis]|nr:hypothetical protein G9A89_015300 [Geosiphon pyriformis]
MSLLRYIKNIVKVGPTNYWKQLNHIGDVKAGSLIGVDQFGNKYFENKEETYGRDRWVEYNHPSDDPTSIPPEWHRWIHKITEYPPKIENYPKPIYKATFIPNFTGTPKAYKPYNTTAPKILEWQPKEIQVLLRRNEQIGEILVVCWQSQSHIAFNPKLLKSRVYFYTIFAF